MKALRRFFVRLTASIARGRDERRLRDEIEEHLALQSAENIKAGMSPEEARRQAVLKFGAVEVVKEQHRDQRGLPFLEHLFRDIRYALRGLRRNPGFSIVAVLTLALGIGTTTAVFSVLDAVVVRVFCPELIKAPRVSSLRPSQGVAETLSKFHRVSELVGAPGVGARLPILQSIVVRKEGFIARSRW